MAEYPSRTCGPCPGLAQFQEKVSYWKPQHPLKTGLQSPKASDYLTQKTVPKPQVKFQDSIQPPRQHLGVSGNYVPPDLHQSPVNTEQLEVVQEDVPVKRHNWGGMPPCAEASMKQCCLTEEKANRVQIDCEVFNKEGLRTFFHWKISEKFEIFRCSEAWERNFEKQSCWEVLLS